MLVSSIFVPAFVYGIRSYRVKTFLSYRVTRKYGQTDKVNTIGLPHLRCRALIIIPEISWHVTLSNQFRSRKQFKYNLWCVVPDKTISYYLGSKKFCSH